MPIRLTHAGGFWREGWRWAVSRGVPALVIPVPQEGVECFARSPVAKGRVFRKKPHVPSGCPQRPRVAVQQRKLAFSHDDGFYIEDFDDLAGTEDSNGTNAGVVDLPRQHLVHGLLRCHNCGLGLLRPLSRAVLASGHDYLMKMNALSLNQTTRQGVFATPCHFRPSGIRSPMTGSRVTAEHA